ncbi:hypothetical protein FRB98_009705 [Tulasnella sp. 332]|nr:hypothetical protein FRB98_009705 [Tulasnella sp. 332]
MAFLSLLACILASGASLVDAQVTWNAVPYNPSAIPLAVRSPYLSTWLQQGTGKTLFNEWPTFWNGDITGWAGYIRVDGTAYAYMGTGGGATASVQKSVTITSTQSTFVITAGGIDLTVNFLSPVEPTSLVNQSLPFSYLALSAIANDGRSHAVQFYSDISCEWCSGDDSQVVNWTTTTTNGVVIHEAGVESQEPFTEFHDHSEQGQVYFATTNTSSLTYMTGFADVTTRPYSTVNGVLDNTVNSTFRALNLSWPVFSFAHDIGTVGITESSPTVYAIGRVRDPAIEYILANNITQERSLYFWSQYSSVNDALSAFILDYPNALIRAIAFDKQVQNDSEAISSDYADIVALSIRQAFGATELTISKDGSGGWNTSDVMMFMKEISSSGNVNTVDVIFPSWPVFLYTNPALGKYLLEPLLAYQATGQYPNTYAMHDLGTAYPRALGHPAGNDQAMPLEESANMLIMVLSHYQKTNDMSLLNQYAPLLAQWASYLVSVSLAPGDQASTDDFAGPLNNQTNLAIKGIIGIEAFSKISSALKLSVQSSNYSSTAASYAAQFKTLATDVTGRHLDLSILTSAIVTNTTLRANMISSVRSHSANGQNASPMSDWYDSITGIDNGFAARPVVGGHLANMVLSGSPSSSNNSKSGLSGGAKGGIAAGIIILALILIAFAIFWFVIRPRRRKNPPPSMEDIDADLVTRMNPYPAFNMDGGHQQSHTPFNPYGNANMALGDGVSPTYEHTTLVPASTTAASSSEPSLIGGGKGGTGKGGVPSPHDSAPILSPASTSRPLPVPGGAAPSMMAAAAAGPRQELDAADVAPPQSEEVLPPPYKYRPRSDLPVNP